MEEVEWVKVTKDLGIVEAECWIHAVNRCCRNSVRTSMMGVFMRWLFVDMTTKDNQTGSGDSCRHCAFQSTLKVIKCPKSQDTKLLSVRNQPNCAN
jgi:hypothetical protein